MSALTKLAACPGAMALSWKQDNDGMSGESGKAADTGTAVGLAIELYHRGEELGAIADRLPQLSKGGALDRQPFPRADVAEALRVLGRYSTDPRNPRAAVRGDSLERAVELRLQPHPLDPTKEPVMLLGHLDQVREGADGVLEVWDLKHSRYSGPDLVRSYAWQQAAYTVATAQSYGRPTRWGGILRTKGYLTRERRTPGEEPAFFHSGYTWEDCLAALDQVRLLVALARSGRVPLQPGDVCSWCPAFSFRQCRRELAPTPSRLTV